jgi:hypothetical protein
MTEVSPANQRGVEEVVHLVEGSGLMLEQASRSVRTPDISKKADALLAFIFVAAPRTDG